MHAVGSRSLATQAVLKFRIQANGGSVPETPAASTLIKWTPSPHRPSLKHVRVNHRGAHIRVPEQLLDGPNIRPGLEQMRRETVAEGVAGNRFAEHRSTGRLLHSA